MRLTIGKQVYFNAESGNDASKPFTVAGREKANGVNFVRLAEVGGLFLPTRFAAHAG